MTARATTSTLLEMVRLFVRTSSADLQDTQILAFANHELHGALVPSIAELNQAYFRYTDSIVSDGSTTTYTIHPRAIGNRVAAVYTVNGNGLDYALYVGNKIDPGARRSTSSGSSDCPFAYVHNNQIILVPALTGGFTLGIDIYIRPGDLVLAGSAARQVTTVNAGSLVLDGASPVATGVFFDIISNKSPFKHVAIDQTATVAGSTLTFTPPTGVAVGDWVCAAQTSPIPQIPYECHPALYELVAGRVLSSLGDSTGAALHAQAAQTIMQSVVPLLCPRIVEPPRKMLDGEPVEVGFGFYRAWEG